MSGSSIDQAAWSLPIPKTPTPISRLRHAEQLTDSRRNELRALHPPVVAEGEVHRHGIGQVHQPRSRDDAEQAEGTLGDVDADCG
jgi:hypothetical protein